MGIYLRRGSRGNQVLRLQAALNDSPPTSLPALAVDGIFGRNTARRVREFQRNHGLSADGIVGPKTRALLPPLDHQASGPVPGTSSRSTNGQGGNGSTPQYRLRTPREVEAEAAARVTLEDLDRAKRHLLAYIRWRTRPQPAAGMGGIFPGEHDTGRVQYPYLNWLLAYYVTVDSLLADDGIRQAERAWSDFKLRMGMHPDAPGQNGADKAIWVWNNKIPRRAQNAIVENWRGQRGEPRDFHWRVCRRLKSYIRSEVERLNAFHDYGFLRRIFGGEFFGYTLPTGTQ